MVPEMDWPALGPDCPRSALVRPDSYLDRPAETGAASGTLAFPAAATLERGSLLRCSNAGSARSVVEVVQWSDRTRSGDSVAEGRDRGKLWRQPYRRGRGYPARTRRKRAHLIASARHRRA